MEDPLRAAEYAIGFESLRYIALLEAARAGSGAALARQLGIAARPLRRFLSGADPSPTVWEALTGHVRRLNGAKPLAPVGFLGFALVAEALPVHLRRQARLRMASALTELCDERGEPPPGWIDAVVDLWAG
jgi:hypothetical protein